VTGSLRRRPPQVALRRARMSDLAALIALERERFKTDQLSRRSLRHFIASSQAAMIVAGGASGVVGCILVLYPPRSKLARLYSYVVAKKFEGQGIGRRLLAAAEDTARRRGRRAMRLEVHEHNTRAIARYEKSGYRMFGRHDDYYDDHGAALRFEKPLAAPRRRAPRRRSVLLRRANRA